jgi:hypothetical protein
MPPRPTAGTTVAAQFRRRTRCGTLSDPMNVNGVREINLKAKGELKDVFDGSERVVGVVIQRPYMRQVYVP